MADSKVIKALAKVMIAAAWADSTVNNDEINCLKDLLFQLPGMTARDWDELEIYIDSPVGEAERERLVNDLLSNLKTESDKAQALNAIDTLVKADGKISAEEQITVEEMRTAIQESSTGLFSRMGKLVGNSVNRRSQSLESAPNRENYLDDFARNKIYYAVSRKLELEGKPIALPEAELRKLSLAGGLMARVAYVDRQVLTGEIDTMVQAIQNHWRTSAVESALVAEIAVSEIGKGMDYYRLSREFFKSTNEAERLQFLDALFAVAAGDGFVSNDEIEEIRTISTVQKLTHQQFIDAKLRVPPEQRTN
jgi:uncharacterized tellurite resistance protein B-like protein